MVIPKETYPILLNYFNSKTLYYRSPLSESDKLSIKLHNGEFLLFIGKNYHNTVSLEGLISDIIILKDNNRDHYEYIINNYPEILY